MGGEEKGGRIKEGTKEKTRKGRRKEKIKKKTQPGFGRDTRPIYNLESD